ncbi:hypothetical protein [Modestobacter sp. DSM 44400]|uniref:hypothetical protein n=1 Tax=Modestobacter sp. DSM 44400 TaxID=1550230 RepID=UPI00158767A8|nr:hypothetical protein [Modestobacter sp. DSM 44400]
MEGLQRYVVEVRATKLAEPSDLFTIGGHSVADFLGDDGEVDGAKVADAVTALLATRPRLSAWQQQVESMAAGSPNFDGGARSIAGPRPSWSDVMRQGTGR